LPTLQLIRISERSRHPRAARGRWIKDYASGADARALCPSFLEKRAFDAARSALRSHGRGGEALEELSRNSGEHEYSVLVQTHDDTPIMNGRSCARVEYSSITRAANGSRYPREYVKY